MLLTECGTSCVIGSTAGSRCACYPWRLCGEGEASTGTEIVRFIFTDEICAFA